MQRAKSEGAKTFVVVTYGNRGEEPGLAIARSRPLPLGYLVRNHFVCPAQTTQGSHIKHGLARYYSLQNSSASVAAKLQSI